MEAIRNYIRADLERMVALDNECFPAEFRFSRSSMRRFAESSNAITLVVEAPDGTLNGFAIAHLQRNAAGTLGYVTTLDVAPAARRTGVAGRLMDEMERRAEAEGALQMMLHVFVQNEPAICFYEGQGYRRVGLEPEFYGGPGWDAYVYTKSLQGRG